MHSAISIDDLHRVQPCTPLYRKQYSGSEVYVSMKLSTISSVPEVRMSCSVVFGEDEPQLLALGKCVRACLLPVAKRQRCEPTTV